MVISRPITKSERRVLEKRQMRFFRDSGGRLIVPPYSNSDFYISNVTGSMGIALEEGMLGVDLDGDSASEEFKSRARLRVPRCPDYGESAEFCFYSPKVGSKTYYIFSLAKYMKKSSKHGRKPGELYIAVPMEAMRGLGVIGE